MTRDVGAENDRLRGKTRLLLRERAEDANDLLSGSSGAMSDPLLSRCRRNSWPNVAAPQAAGIAIARGPWPRSSPLPSEAGDGSGLFHPRRDLVLVEVIHGCEVYATRVLAHSNRGHERDGRE